MTASARYRFDACRNHSASSRSRSRIAARRRRSDSSRLIASWTARAIRNPHFVALPRNDASSSSASLWVNQAISMGTLWPSGIRPVSAGRARVQAVSVFSISAATSPSNSKTAWTSIVAKICPEGVDMTPCVERVGSKIMPARSVTMAIKLPTDRPHRSANGGVEPPRARSRSACMASASCARSGLYTAPYQPIRSSPIRAPGNHVETGAGVRASIAPRQNSHTRRWRPAKGRK